MGQYMQPSGAKKKRLAQAIFSKDGPNLIRPEVTNNPKVTPKTQRLSNKKINGTPILKMETPNNGIASIAAGTKPIKVLNFDWGYKQIGKISTPNFFKKHHIVTNARSE